MSPRRTSRKVRREKKKVLSQSVIMIIVAILLLLAFLFVILPSFIGFVTNVLNSSSPFQETDEIPPQIPIISAPVSATNSAELSISGFGEPESDVIIILNGSKEDEIQIADDGTFSVPLTLSEGNNSVSAYSRDAAENESPVTREYTTKLDTQDPELTITEPEDGTEIQGRGNQMLTIQGTTDKDTTVRVYVNDRIVFPKADGTWKYDFRLSEGENKLNIRAVDAAGNETDTEVTYKFSF